MKADPIGGKPVAPETPVGLYVFVVRIKFVIFPILVLSLQKNLQDGSR